MSSDMMTGVEETSPNGSEQRGHAIQALSRAIPILELPLDRPRSTTRAFTRARYAEPLESGLVDALGIWNQSVGAVPQITLLAALHVLLNRYSGETHIVVGMLVAKQEEAEAPSDGLSFTHIVLSHAEVRSEDRFVDLVLRLRKTFSDGSHAGGGDVDAMTGIEQASTDGIQVLFAYGKQPGSIQPANRGQFGPNDSVPTVAGRNSISHDLLFDIREQGGTVHVSIQYRADLFLESTIARMLGHFRSLLREGVGVQATLIRDFRLLSADERAQLNTLALADEPEPSADPIPVEFSLTARRQPAATAVNASDEIRVSYSELDAWTDWLARTLQTRGAESGVVLGLLIRDPLVATAAMIATLKAGSAFAVLDPETPVPRLRSMLASVGAPLLLTDCEMDGSLAPLADDVGTVFPVASLAGFRGLSREKRSLAVPLPTIHPHDIAYVAFTSGSTGAPKAIAHRHDSLARAMAWVAEKFSLGPGVRLGQWASLSFDVAYADIFATLAHGGELCIPPRAMRADSGRFAEWVHSYGVRVLQIVPSFGRPLFEFALDDPRPLLRSLEAIMFVGEALSFDVVKLCRECAPEARLYNLYGPTETIFTTFHPIERGYDVADAVPIGRPIPGRAIRLTDRNGHPVPVGVFGEIHIESEHVGWWRTRDEGADTHPCGAGRAVNRRTSYRTGDLARWNADGNLLFGGRTDAQVKVRGCRVDLHAVEAAVARALGARECAVVARVCFGTTTSLDAFVVIPEWRDEAALRRLVHDVLPVYMAPSRFFQCASLPRTRTGKIDRLELSRLAVECGEAPQSDRPRTDTERDLAEIWCDVLHLKSVGRNDGFFDLGGHSLAAMTLANRIRQRWWVDFGAVSFSANATLASIAEHIDSTGTDADFEALQMMELVKRLADAEVRTEETARGRPTGRTTVNQTALWREFRSLSEERQQLVVKWAYERGIDLGMRAPLVREDRGRREFPLSLAQRRLWFLSRLEPEKPTYNCTAVWRIRGRVDVGALEGALSELVRRHEILRTAFRVKMEEPMQVVEPALPLGLERLDLTGVAEAAWEPELRIQLRANVNRPFDVGISPLMRGAIARVSDREHLFILAAHHLVVDGWSFNLIINEIMAFYRDLVAGKPASLAEPAIQYGDYATWQREFFSEATLRPHLDYWRAKLQGLESVFQLPTDYRRPPRPSHRGGTVAFTLAQDVTAALRCSAKRLQVSVYTCLLAAVNTVLHLYSGNDEVVLGVATACRERPELERLIGFLVNNLVLRTRIGERATLADTVTGSHTVAQEAYAHQRVPFDRLVAELRHARDLSRNPLFQVALTFERRAALDSGHEDLVVEHYCLPSEASIVDLTFELYEDANVIGGAIIYSKDLFEPATIVRLRDGFVDLVCKLATNPGARVPARDAGLTRPAMQEDDVEQGEV